jgi:hypothetical protein
MARFQYGRTGETAFPHLEQKQALGLDGLAPHREQEIMDRPCARHFSVISPARCQRFLRRI